MTFYDLKALYIFKKFCLNKRKRRVNKVKYIQQMDESDCGAACIAMIASHYKIKKSITSIRELAGTDTKGTNLAGIIQGVKIIGFSAHALKGDKSALTSELPFP